MMREMTNLWNQVIFLVLVLVSSNRPNAGFPRQLLSIGCCGKVLSRKGRRSSLIVKAATWSTHDLVLLQEQVTELSNSRQNEDKNEVQDVAERRSEISATDLEPSASLG